MQKDSKARVKTLPTRHGASGGLWQRQKQRPRAPEKQRRNRSHREQPAGAPGRRKL